MTTAVGQIAYDFSATANQNPWALVCRGVFYVIMYKI